VFCILKTTVQNAVNSKFIYACKHCAMKVYEYWGVNTFLTSVLGPGKWSSSHNPGERVFSTRWLGG